jgi:hypothetical protein
MDAFVFAGLIEELAVAAEDDVAEGHGGGAAGKPAADDALEEEADKSAVDFEDAVDDLAATAGEKSGQQEEEPDGRGWQCPEIENRP